MSTSLRSRSFAQVDVFSAVPYLGNPVAVVLDADGLDNEAMAGFARWTNLSETTFVLPPSAPGADYRLRIFTPSGELPFAGHPTLGSAHAWLEAGGVPKDDTTVVQQCDAGLVRLRRHARRLAFAAPPLRRGGPLDDATLQRILDGTGLRRQDILDHQWVDNGPGWAAVLLWSADAVLAVELDWSKVADMMFGVAGIRPGGSGAALQVRVFAPGVSVTEDPVTDSLNAGLAQWLIGSGRLPRSYVASQGSHLQRDGRIYLDAVDDDVWVGGDCVTCIRGTVRL